MTKSKGIGILGLITILGILGTVFLIANFCYGETYMNGVKQMSDPNAITAESDPIWTAEKAGYATGTPVYAESDPIWLAEKAGYATGTPVYAESDPVWLAEKAGYATGTPVYAESDPIWAAESNSVLTRLTAGEASSNALNTRVGLTEAGTNANADAITTKVTTNDVLDELTLGDAGSLTNECWQRSAQIQTVWDGATSNRYTLGNAPEGAEIEYMYCYTRIGTAYAHVCEMPNGSTIFAGTTHTTNSAGIAITPEWQAMSTWTDSSVATGATVFLMITSVVDAAGLVLDVIGATP